MKGTTKRQEAVFAAAGLCGVCLYYLQENIALTYTMASNAGVIISIAPFFTAMLTQLFTKEDFQKRKAGCKVQLDSMMMVETLITASFQNRPI